MANHSDKLAKIDAMMEQASKALVKREYFECERLAASALRRAGTLGDYDRVARIVMPLQECRRLKRQLAIEAHHVRIIDADLPQPGDLKAGCYLVCPPRVGVDGRALRELADQLAVPAMVIVREPDTREGLWPIVAVGPVTLRTKVTPPKLAPLVAKPAKKPATKKTGKVAKKTSSKSKTAAAATTEDAGPPVPSPRWFLETSEALGDAAIAAINPEMPAWARVAALIERLEALPDHEKLHQRLQDAARDALREPARRRRPLDEEAWMLDYGEEDRFDDRDDRD